MPSMSGGKASGPDRAETGPRGVSAISGHALRLARTATPIVLHRSASEEPGPKTSCESKTENVESRAERESSYNPAGREFIGIFILPVS